MASAPDENGQPLDTRWWARDEELKAIIIFCAILITLFSVVASFFSHDWTIPGWIAGYITCALTSPFGNNRKKP